MFEMITLINLLDYNPSDSQKKTPELIVLVNVTRKAVYFLSLLFIAV